jgi:UDP-3-O-acyl-N-acetylglucosamine deacetylase
VEHLLSALEGFGVDNARIEIEGGPEVPIVDGSALGWAIDLHQVHTLYIRCHNPPLHGSIAS